MRKTIAFIFLLVLLSSINGSSIALGEEITASKILDLVNLDRRDYGLPPLKLDPTLTLAALAKAEDMLRNSYFAHVSPIGLKPWYWFKTLGYNYTYAGENLAAGYTDASELENSWMSSSSHRANILSPHYSDLGLAVVKEGERTLVVTFFGSKDNKLTLRQ